MTPNVLLRLPRLAFRSFQPPEVAVRRATRSALPALARMASWPSARLAYVTLRILQRDKFLAVPRLMEGSASPRFIERGSTYFHV